MTSEDRRVSTAACDEYDPRRVDEALTRLLSPLGGMGAFVSPGQSVFHKVNLLSKAEPGRAVTTHPEVVRAVVRSVLAAGARQVSVGDSPGGRSTAASAKALFETSGIAAVCREEGAGAVLVGETLMRHADLKGKVRELIQ